ncbi:hypothetical protein, partial [Salinisphaera japonica]|uniref:hypothetical protein n=1 Tax=Salinisphaera japonica TaxID=1304270 RepID=UPI001C85B36F
ISNTQKNHLNSRSRWPRNALFGLAVAGVCGLAALREMCILGIQSHGSTGFCEKVGRGRLQGLKQAGFWAIDA